MVSRDKGPLGERVEIVRGHSALPWSSKFYEMGGYDCMSDAITIVDASGTDIFDLDFSMYDDAPDVGKHDALTTVDHDARFIVTACNHHDELVEMVRARMRHCGCQSVAGGTYRCPECVSSAALLSRIDGEGETS